MVAEISVSKEPEVKSRYPYIEVVGPFPLANEGVIKLLTRAWGIKPFITYCQRYSFCNQLGIKVDEFQLKNEVELLTRITQEELRGLKGFLNGSCAILQQGLETAKLFGEVCKAKGKIDAREHSLYLALIDSLQSASFIPSPDLVVAILAKPETLKTLVEERGEGQEIQALESGDLLLFEETLEGWVGKNESVPPMITLDVEGLRFLNTQPDQETYAQEIADFVGCHVDRINREGLAGEQLLMPDFCIPKITAI